MTESSGQRRSIRQWADDNQGAVYITLVIVVLFLLDFLWSVHTQHKAEADAERTQTVAIAQVSRVILAEQKAIASSCDFIRPLTGLPVTIPAGMAHPSELSVQLIEGAREQYAAQCTPPEPALGPPDPSLVRWAAFYHVHVTP